MLGVLLPVANEQTNVRYSYECLIKKEKKKNRVNQPQLPTTPTRMISKQQAACLSYDFPTASKHCGPPDGIYYSIFQQVHIL